MQRIAILIVTYNPDINILARLFERLKDSALDLTLYLIDNASENVNELKKMHYPDGQFIYLPENIGLAAAQNQGLQKILSSNCESVIFFDQDSEPTDEFISQLIQAVRELGIQGKKVGAVGPVFSDPRTGTMYPFIKINGFFIKKVFPNSEIPLNVSFLINSGMLISIQTLKEVGIMRGELFIDYVDIEWCLRAASLGYSFYAVPKAKMSHTIGDNRKNILGREVSIHSPLRRYYLARNSIYMMRLPYVPLGYKFRESIFSIIRTFMFIACIDNKKLYLRYIFRGWKDGWLGKYGKYSE